MVDAVLQIVFNNLNSLIKKEIGLVWGAHTEMEKLSDTVLAIRGVLKEAEVNQLKDKTIKNWLKKLKDVAYDAEDILDDYATEALRSEVYSRNKNCTMKVSNSFLSCITSKQLIFRHKIGRRIREIRDRLDEINDERHKFNLKDRVVYKEIEVNERETGSVLAELKVYGRDEEKEMIVQRLLNNINNKEVLIYPIIGMGGLGKTTLAQLVCNDERVEKHFELKIWVCVSENFDVKRLLKETIESAVGNTSDLINLALDPMQCRLRDILGGKRFLLVLDDVWNEDHEKWDVLKHSLTCGAIGSSIIVWRFPNIASKFGDFQLPEPGFIARRAATPHRPHLETRCERERGEDWHKISHIPNLTFSSDY